MIVGPQCRVRIEIIEVHDNGVEVIIERRTTNWGSEAEARQLFEKMYDAGELAR